MALSIFNNKILLIITSFVKLKHEFKIIKGPDKRTMSYKESSLKDIATAFYERLKNVSVQQDLEQIRIDFLGRKGKLSELVDHLKTVSIEEKRELGPQIQALKQELTTAFEAREQTFAEEKRTQEAERLASFDVTSYKPGTLHGSLHPYTHVIQDIENIFMSMGFAITEGQEVETDFVNFEALNIPANHPARDTHDTFWLDIPGLLLRTHTSTAQVRAMMNNKPPLAIAAPGRCYRHEATDASHDFMFMQCEGLVVDKNISMAHLLGTMRQFLQALFKKEKLDIRMRSSFFPFVEPGVEIDMTCPFCTTGCSVCKKTRWIEICGAGMVHPHVLKSCGIDPNEYSGFAFGFGLTRLVMLKYGIHDIRLLHNPKVEFLKQF